MYGTRSPTGVVGGFVLIALVFVVAIIIEWLDRATDSPVMRRRVNGASDAFLEERGTILTAASRSTRSFMNELTDRWL
jgi:hypothetical protein